MTIRELHAITERLIEGGKGAGTVGVNLSTFPLPDDEGIVMPAGDASGQYLEAPEGGHGIGGFFLVIEG